MNGWTSFGKTIAVVVLSGLIAWGAWVTLGVAGAAPQEAVTAVQERIEDKLDEIHLLILNLHKGE
jgi:hypothetical protein